MTSKSDFNTVFQATIPGVFFFFISTIAKMFLSERTIAKLEASCCATTRDWLLSSGFPLVFLLPTETGNTPTFESNIKGMQDGFCLDASRFSSLFKSKCVVSQDTMHDATHQASRQRERLLTKKQLVKSKSCSGDLWNKQRHHAGSQPKTSGSATLPSQSLSYVTSLW